ncbi:Insulin-degrading enzyme [Smittium mucronatum]|uniref:Insulin-degrading enzyme n=1 Tax=Smittium mucronatum TaxID=133383 RepID=A0A1R0H6W9_9FUNG|nr:Insulin-degrading enzyme [Smittium mucronatum]
MQSIKDCEVEIPGSKISSVPPSEIPEGFSLRTSDQGIPYFEFTKAPIQKSTSDNRNYSLIRLQNGLVVLLAQDAKENKSCAALNVKVGSLSDPKDYMGLAHFCEHMLFMGTEKYPEENEYSKYLSIHGGHSNAYTDTENTCYYFEISQNYLEGALDRFAQFFISPLLLPNCVERELNAVDSEFKKNLQNDSWRIHQLEKSLLKKDHPFSYFSSGNYKTLLKSSDPNSVHLREKLLEFYEKFYSSDIMKLVVVGKESLTELENMVVNKFSPIKSKGITYKSPTDHPLSSECLGKVILAKSIRDKRTLKLIFPFPDEQSLFKTKPSSYLANLIGHEADGSILSLLKSKGWASEIMTSCSGSYGGDFSSFKINISLTEAGVDKYKEIITIIFAYIRLIREAGPQRWYFDELMKTSEIDFRFEEKQEIINFSTTLSTALHNNYYPPEMAISGQSLVTEFDYNSIEDRIELLNSKNYRAVIVLKDQKITKPSFEEFYKVEYEVQDLPKTLLDDMDNSIDSLPKDIIQHLHLPFPNKFIPEDLSLKTIVSPNPLLEPLLLTKNDQLELWFKKDDRFNLPRGVICLNIVAPETYSSPLSALLCRLFIETVFDSINKITYNAKVAGFGISINETFNGISVLVEGYNDKLGELLLVVLDNMRNLEIKEDEFVINKENVVRNMQNNAHAEPWKQAGFLNNYLSIENQWRYTDKLSTAKLLTIDLLKEFRSKLFKQTYLQILVLGNFDEHESLKISDSILDIMKSSAFLVSERVFNRPVDHQSGKFICSSESSSENNLNNSVMRLIFAPSVSSYSRALLGLILNILQEPFFDQIRTKEQLGYIASSYASLSFSNPLGLTFVVQSESNPEYVDLRISNFLKNYKSFILKMTQLDLDKHLNSLINKREEKPKNMYEESSNFIGQIKSGYYDFSWNLTDIKYLKKIKMNNLIDYWNKYIDPESILTKQLSIHIYSSFVNKPTKTVVSSHLQTMIALQGCLAREGFLKDIVYTPYFMSSIIEFIKNSGKSHSSPDFDDRLSDYILNLYISEFKSKKYEKTGKSENSYKSHSDTTGEETEDHILKIKTKIKSPLGFTNYIKLAISMCADEVIRKEGPDFIQPQSKQILEDPESETALYDPEKEVLKFNYARGFVLTPSKNWVFFDPTTYKITSNLLPGPVSHHSLIPKYD